MTIEQGIQVLKFEATLNEIYVSKIEAIKCVLKTFDGKQANCRIADALGQTIPHDECYVASEKAGNDLLIHFSSHERCINVGQKGSSLLVYVSNSKMAILCKDAACGGRFNYQIAEPQIDEAAAKWAAEANELKTTDYTALIAEYKGISAAVEVFQNKVSYRIKDMLRLKFEIKYKGYC